VELRQLEQFVAVAEERHFTRAAARVHVVQSSLSAAIRALERELGDALFVRNSRQVLLTPAGRALLPAARRALAAAEEGRDAVAGIRGVLHGRLHVGAIQSLGVVDLAAALARLRREHPGVTVRLSHTAAGALAQAVGDGEIDIAFLDGPVDESRLTRIPLGTDELVLAVPEADPLAARASVDLADPALQGRDFVAYRTDSALEAQISTACSGAGLARRVVCEAENLGYLLDLVGHGAGLAILPPLAVRAAAGRVRAIPLAPALGREISAVVPAHRKATAPAKALLDLVSGVGAGGGGGGGAVTRARADGAAEQEPDSVGGTADREADAVGAGANGVARADALA
jgi:DNA-binding transcriptional LysR family regulator